MRWIINILSNYLRFIVNIAAVFLLTPLLIEQLGQEVFGLWSLIFAFVALFGLLDLGLATTAVKAVSEHWANNDFDTLREVLGTLLGVYTALGLLCFSVIWLIAPVLAQSYTLSIDIAAEFVFALRLLGAVTALSFPLSIYRAVLIGSGHMSSVNLTDLLFITINIIGVYSILSMGFGLQELALVTASTILGSFLIFVPNAQRKCPQVTVSVRFFQAVRFTELLRFSVYIFIANIAMLVILRIDPLVIGHYLSLEAVAIYAIAAKVAEYTYLLNKQFSNALMPLISQANGINKPDQVQQIMLDGSRLIMAIALPFIALLFWFSPEFIMLWVGGEFSQASTLLRILLIGMVVGVLQLIPANVLGMGGKHQYLAKVMAVSALVNLGLSIVLIQLWGLHGVALATIFATIVVEMLVVIPSACAHVQLSVMTFLRSVMGVTVLPFVAMVTTVTLLTHFYVIAAISDLLIIGALSGLSYIFTFAISGLKRNEREWLKSLILRSKLVAMRNAFFVKFVR